MGFFQVQPLKLCTSQIMTMTAGQAGHHPKESVFDKLVMRLKINFHTNWTFTPEDTLAVEPHIPCIVHIHRLAYIIHAVFQKESDFTCGVGCPTGVPLSTHTCDFCRASQLTSGLAPS